MEEGQVPVVIETLHDLSAETRFELQLRESEARFRAMADTAPVLIWLTDDNMQMGYVNQSWLEFTGRSLQQEMGRGWAESLHASDYRTWLRLSAHALAEQQPFEVEVRLRRHDGEYRWLACHGVPRVSPAGVFVGYIGSCVDITDLKLAERVLRESRDELQRRVVERTAELVEANDALKQEKDRQQELIQKLEEAQGQLLQSEKMASIGQLAAGVAHEINNPIGFISGNLGTLRHYVGDLLGVLAAYEQRADPLLSDDPQGWAAISIAKQKADLDYLRQDLPNLLGETEDGVRRVKNIVRDLKEFSHVSEAEWQSADLHKGLDSTLNLVWNEIKYKAQVVKEYGQIPPVECLAFQINQVFMNLLINASHAIVDAGVITLRTGQVDEFVWVEVEDSGAGIAPENMTRIFEPFFTTKPIGQGTGLGLSVSYGIMRKHGGRIDVRSEVGHGTVFRLWLPVRQPAHVEEQGVSTLQ